MVSFGLNGGMLTFGKTIVMVVDTSPAVVTFLRPTDTLNYSFAAVGKVVVGSVQCIESGPLHVAAMVAPWTGVAGTPADVNINCAVICLWKTKGESVKWLEIALWWYGEQSGGSDPPWLAPPRGPK